MGDPHELIEDAVDVIRNGNRAIKMGCKPPHILFEGDTANRQHSPHIPVTIGPPLFHLWHLRPSRSTQSRKSTGGHHPAPLR